MPVHERSRLANRLDGATLVSYGRLLGDAAVLAGRYAEARNAYEQALVVSMKVRFRPEVALVRLGLADLLLSKYPSEQALAAEHLHVAIADFQAMQMQPSLRHALELLGPRGSSAAPAAETLPNSSEPLTEREREVATLLAQGMSNREIATTLVISEQLGV